MGRLNPEKKSEIFNSNSKTRFRMYKAGKQWLVAGTATLAGLFGASIAQPSTVKAANTVGVAKDATTTTNATAKSVTIPAPSTADSTATNSASESTSVSESTSTSQSVSESESASQSTSVANASTATASNVTADTNTQNNDDTATTATDTTTAPVDNQTTSTPVAATSTPVTTTTATDGTTQVTSPAAFSDATLKSLMASLPKGTTVSYENGVTTFSLPTDLSQADLDNIKKAILAANPVQGSQIKITAAAAVTAVAAAAASYPVAGLTTSQQAIWDAGVNATVTRLQGLLESLTSGTGSFGLPSNLGKVANLLLFYDSNTKTFDLTGSHKLGDGTNKTFMQLITGNGWGWQSNSWTANGTYYNFPLLGGQTLYLDDHANFYANSTPSRLTVTSAMVTQLWQAAADQLFKPYLQTLIDYRDQMKNALDPSIDPNAAKNQNALLSMSDYRNGDMNPTGTDMTTLFQLAGSLSNSPLGDNPNLKAVFGEPTSLQSTDPAFKSFDTTYKSLNQLLNLVIGIIQNAAIHKALSDVRSLGLANGGFDLTNGLSNYVPSTLADAIQLNGTLSLLVNGGLGGLYQGLGFSDAVAAPYTNSVYQALADGISSAVLRNANYGIQTALKEMQIIPTNKLTAAGDTIYTKAQMTADFGSKFNPTDPTSLTSNQFNFASGNPGGNWSEFLQAGGYSWMNKIAKPIITMAMQDAVVNYKAPTQTTPASDTVKTTAKEVLDTLVSQNVLKQSEEDAILNSKLSDPTTWKGLDQSGNASSTALAYKRPGDGTQDFIFSLYNSVVNAYKSAAADYIKAPNATDAEMNNTIFRNPGDPSAVGYTWAQFQKDVNANGNLTAAEKALALTAIPSDARMTASQPDPTTGLATPATSFSLDALMAVVNADTQLTAAQKSNLITKLTSAQYIQYQVMAYNKVYKYLQASDAAYRAVSDADTTAKTGVDDAVKNHASYTTAVTTVGAPTDLGASALANYGDLFSAYTGPDGKALDATQPDFKPIVVDTTNPNISAADKATALAAQNWMAQQLSQAYVDVYNAEGQRIVNAYTAGQNTSTQLAATNQWAAINPSDTTNLNKLSVGADGKTATSTTTPVYSTSADTTANIQSMVGATKGQYPTAFSTGTIFKDGYTSNTIPVTVTYKIASGSTKKLKVSDFMGTDVTADTTNKTVTKTITNKDGSTIVWNGTGYDATAGTVTQLTKIYYSAIGTTLSETAVETTNGLVAGDVQPEQVETSMTPITFSYSDSLQINQTNPGTLKVDSGTVDYKDGESATQHLADDSQTVTVHLDFVDQNGNHMYKDVVIPKYQTTVNPDGTLTVVDNGNGPVPGGYLQTPNDDQKVGTYSITLTDAGKQYVNDYIQYVANMSTTNLLTALNSTALTGTLTINPTVAGLPTVTAINKTIAVGTETSIYSQKDFFTVTNSRNEPVDVNNDLQHASVDFSAIDSSKPGVYPVTMVYTDPYSGQVVRKIAVVTVLDGQDSLVNSLATSEANSTQSMIQSQADSTAASLSVALSQANSTTSVANSETSAANSAHSVANSQTSQALSTASEIASADSAKQSQLIADSEALSQNIQNSIDASLEISEFISYYGSTTASTAVSQGIASGLDSTQTSINASIAGSEGASWVTSYADSLTEQLSESNAGSQAESAAVSEGVTDPGSLQSAYNSGVSMAQSQYASISQSNSAKQSVATSVSQSNSQIVSLQNSQASEGSAAISQLSNLGSQSTSTSIANSLEQSTASENSVVSSEANSRASENSNAHSNLTSDSTAASQAQSTASEDSETASDLISEASNSNVDENSRNSAASQASEVNSAASQALSEASQHSAGASAAESQVNSIASAASEANSVKQSELNSAISDASRAASQQLSTASQYSELQSQAQSKADSDAGSQKASDLSEVQSAASAASEAQSAASEINSGASQVQSAASQNSAVQSQSQSTVESLNSVASASQSAVQSVVDSITSENSQSLASTASENSQSIAS
ncbi:KxYKxGKxW signal peptide domain-containing protein, partial [Lacticaseibacillus brantae]|uniref:KxYKxGKxW signal peptide domain-containing protein n=1 Tax=Lacticaseibacillus brantae TaxID=943673 RepID=UPI0007111B94